MASVFRAESSFRRSAADVELAAYRYHLAKVEQVDRASYGCPQSVEKSERHDTEAKRNHGDGTIKGVFTSDKLRYVTN